MDNLSSSRKKDTFLKSDFGKIMDDFSVLAKDLHRRDWENHLRKLLHLIGYDSYLLSIGASTTGDPFNKIMTTYPAEWLRRYKEENYIQADPIIRHCRHHFVPLFGALHVNKHAVGLMSSGRHARGMAFSTGSAFLCDTTKWWDHSMLPNV